MVECEPGYDGGMRQSFHLEVYNSAVEHLQANVSTQDSPVFQVGNLPSATSFILVLYASNAKGRSNSVALMTNTLMPAERRTEEEGGVNGKVYGVLYRLSYNKTSYNFTKLYTCEAKCRRHLLYIWFKLICFPLQDIYNWKSSKITGYCSHGRFLYAVNYINNEKRTITKKNGVTKILWSGQRYVVTPSTKGCESRNSHFSFSFIVPTCGILLFPSSDTQSRMALSDPLKVTTKIKRFCLSSQKEQSTYFSVLQVAAF